MQRHALTDAQWRRVQKVLPKQTTGPEAMRGDRLFIEAVLYRAKTGLPWRDLPERFGLWKSVYNRFANWAKKGRWAAMFHELQLETDEVGSIVEGSVVRAHQDASGVGIRQGEEGRSGTGTGTGTGTWKTREERDESALDYDRASSVMWLSSRNVPVPVPVPVPGSSSLN